MDCCCYKKKLQVKIIDTTVAGSEFDYLTRSAETDIGFCFSRRYVGKINPRSSMSWKSIFIDGGILDYDYRGNVRVIFQNPSNNTVEVSAGDYISQALFLKK